jgi:hypothetical protein
MRERLLLAGLLDELADLLKTSDEYKELSTDEADRNRRKIESICDKINLSLAQGFQIKTPTGEQRAIHGMDQ